MFTSHGYQPSIFMDSCPKHICSAERQSRSRNRVSSEHNDRAEVRLADYIQIRLDSPPSVPPSMPTTTATVMSVLSPALMPNAPHNIVGDFFNAEISSDDGSMEWESCASSPLVQTVPDVNSRSTSPFLGLEQSISSSSSVTPIAEMEAPITLAFQNHTMAPHLSFRGRSQSIFLTAGTSSDSRMHRRVRDLLHNTSVQKIRSWLKSTIESCALEQWRNMTLLRHLTEIAAVPKTTALDSMDQTSSNGGDCPICFKSGTIMKVIATCGHMICWKCEKDLDRAGNIACPMCRRIRLASTYKNVEDLFRSTIGLHPRDYTHEYCTPSAALCGTTTLFLQVTDGYDCSDDDDQAEVEHELTDRYLWEQSASFLEHLQSVERCPLKQYFQLNAVQDLCFKPSTEQHLPEYNDQAIIEPPTSGLVLPAHRLYIALIHFCIDMLTLPKLTEFQLQPQFKREAMLLELVTLFLVPTDEFSPRGPYRIFNAPAWIEHGQYILARIYRFIQSKARQNMREFADDERLEADQAARVAADAAVPSTPIPRHILYLGTWRWTWIAQSLVILLTWIQTAQSNPSMVPLVASWSGPSSLGKRSPSDGENPRPLKRRRLRRGAVVQSL
ncbi:hypothetical protein BGZ79_009924 [Entomortierella chlamydospora]|nr:hypothetical protein BGZ79_009924 [Entomortierella chlamydospora]